MLKDGRKKTQNYCRLRNWLWALSKILYERLFGVPRLRRYKLQGETPFLWGFELLRDKKRI
jgi:hypothetical protein